MGADDDAPAIARPGIEGTPPESDFDDLTLLASRVCGTPIALLTLGGTEGQRIRSRHGLDDAATPGEDSFFAYAILNPHHVLQVEDATRDERFQASPQVLGEPHVRFYAGAPLLSPDGLALGVLGVIDRVPRRLTGDQLEALRALGRQAGRVLELRRQFHRSAREADERALAQAALLESEARFRRLSDAQIDAVAVTDRGRLVAVNRAFGAMFRMDEDQAIGRESTEFVTPEELPRVREFIPAQREGFYRTVARRSDGSTFPAEVSAKSITIDGRPARVTVVRDLSEREAVDRLKNEFVSVVSHELRTPLTSIRGSLGLLEGGIAGGLPPQALELVGVARSNADRLIRLVNEILDLEKMEAGRLELQVVAIDPGDVVAATLEGIVALADARRVRLLARIESYDAFAGDRDRVIQVLTNLVSNAIKFSPEGGDVVVRVAGGRAGFARVSVEDAGHGIPPEQRDRLFTRFGQLDSSDQRQKGGTGLGLAISRSIVEQLAGRIGVESVPGRTEFWFELPLARAERPDARAGVALHDRKRILLVEDDPDLSDILAIRLTHEGYAVEHAPTLAGARQSLARARPDVVLLDVHLPDGNGLDLLGVEAGAHAGIPVVVLSGGEPELDDRGRWAMDWLVKPFDEPRLFVALRRAVRTPGPPRAVVAEDDDAVRQVVCASLGAIGIDCHQAPDGVEAVRLARAVDPDLVVLDVQLPRMSGFEVVEQLRTGPTVSAALLVYTQRDLSAVERRQLALGPTRHLTKTRAAEGELVRAARELLTGIVALP